MRQWFLCLGHSNRAICSPLSPFCSENFLFASLLYWEANSYYPRGLVVRKEILQTSEMDETEALECLGHSNWAICSPLSPFCYGNFQFVSPLYWEANSYYPRRLIVGKGNSHNSRNGRARRVSVPGAFKLDHLQPFKPILYWQFSICFIFILGGHFLLP